MCRDRAMSSSAGTPLARPHPPKRCFHNRQSMQAPKAVLGKPGTDAVLKIRRVMEHNISTNLPMSRDAASDRLAVLTLH